MTLPAIIRSASQNSHSQRSNAVSHLYWPMFLCLAMTGVLAWLKVPVLPILSMVAALLCLAFSLGSHVYFMLKNPEALRSEKFTIQKMMLERGIQADNTLPVLGNQERAEQVVKGAV